MKPDINSTAANLFCCYIYRLFLLLDESCMFAVMLPYVHAMDCDLNKSFDLFISTFQDLFKNKLSKSAYIVKFTS